MDLLSIDIDGLDSEIFEALDFLPRVICVEVNAGHNPKTDKPLPAEIVVKNIGQPLAVFNLIAEKKGYHLVCFNGNAFYVRQDICEQFSLPAISAVEAYKQFLEALSPQEKEWLYLVNLGFAPPHWRYDNPLLTSPHLSISDFRAWQIRTFFRARLFTYNIVKSIIGINRYH